LVALLDPPLDDPVPPLPLVLLLPLVLPLPLGVGAPGAAMPVLEAPHPVKKSALLKTAVKIARCGKIRFAQLVHFRQGG
jgi:hypothetical protein